MGKVEKSALVLANLFGAGVVLRVVIAANELALRAVTKVPTETLPVFERVWAIGSMTLAEVATAASVLLAYQIKKHWNDGPAQN